MSQHMKYSIIWPRVRLQMEGSLSLYSEPLGFQGFFFQEKSFVKG